MRQRARDRAEPLSRRLIWTRHEDGGVGGARTYRRRIVTGIVV